MAIEVDCVLECGAALGECPIWSPAEARLYWLDCDLGHVHRFDPATGVDEARSLGRKLGSLGLRRAGGLVLAIDTGFAFYDFETEQLDILDQPERARPGNRMNDGRTGPGGHFFAGSMHDPIDPALRAGSFYRLDRDGRAARLFDGLGTANGLAFSPDGRTMYQSDSIPPVQTIWAWDHDPDDGAISNRRVFADTNDLPGRPDGACIDTDGCYWSANVDGWQVVRFTPDGRVDRTIPVPVQKPSMPCFGGPDLDTLFITSIAVGGQPMSGALFACRPGTTGLPEPFFDG